ncbi:nuclear transport factor 2 family protein [Novosphingobium sp.]|uniref:nuclear transport factor 2 family protein n=1 Tax=Novosphingobium sp. TaxID=1874826 RepID=UPI0038BB052F
MAEARPDLVADRDAIRHLLAQYTYAGDRGQLDKLAACFTADGVLEFPGASVAGPEAIARALTQGAGPRAPSPGFVRHHITNPLIETDGSVAQARSYFTVHTAIGPDHSGSYLDRLVRTPEGWRFAHRRVLVDWQSPQSRFRPMVTRP